MVTGKPSFLFLITPHILACTGVVLYKGKVKSVMFSVLNFLSLVLSSVNAKLQESVWFQKIHNWITISGLTKVPGL